MSNHGCQLGPAHQPANRVTATQSSRAVHAAPLTACSHSRASNSSDNVNGQRPLSPECTVNGLSIELQKLLL